MVGFTIYATAYYFKYNANVSTRMDTVDVHLLNIWKSAVLSPFLLEWFIQVHWLSDNTWNSSYRWRMGRGDIDLCRSALN
jgi:hypothetical protein